MVRPAACLFDLDGLLLDERLPMSVAHALDQVTSALFALSRHESTESGPLALAWATATRLASPATGALLRSDPCAAIGEMLDAIGALAGSVPQACASHGDGV